MANLQAAVRVTVNESADPGELLCQWNRLIHGNTQSSKFITCSLMVVDLQSRQLSFATAGHYAPVVLSSDCDAKRQLDAEPTFPLGVVEDATFTTTIADMGADPFALFTYTDGVIEAMNPAGEPFGDDRLWKILRDRKGLNPLTLVKEVRKGVTSFVDGADQSDDITMLAAAVT